MNTIFKHISLGALAVFALASCSSESELQQDANTGVVTFTSSRGARATGTTWTAGDQIGVFMKQNGTTLSGAALSGSTANVSYTTASGNGYFTASSTPLTYPADNSAVDFIAYYPFTTSVSDGVYPVNVADQSAPESIDLLYSSNLVRMNRYSGVGALAFSHQLAQVSLVITSADGSALDGLTATVKNVPTTANFSLADGAFSNLAGTADVKMLVEGSGTSLTASAFLIPGTTASPFVITLTEKTGKEVDVTISRSVTLQQGQNLQYPVSITSSGEVTPVEEASYTRWTETPTITKDQLESSNLQYVIHYITDGSKQVRNYSMLYNKNLKYAQWVAYPLCNYYTKSNTTRTEDWQYDPQIAESSQAYLASSYIGSGYDRGHQIPSADRLVSTEANSQTFYFSNMSPQTSSLNQGIWANLETKVRNWSSNVDTLFVVTGAMPPSTGYGSYVRDRAYQNCYIPAYYFKALCRIDKQTGTAYTIAFKFNNEEWSGSETAYMNAALSVKELEDLTGFTFFPTIDASYKTSYDTSRWQ